tara:strand:+ start:57 stop:677 length:621 start_codon:yes stop_codon:yes gene_type:complete
MVKTKRNKRNKRNKRTKKRVYNLKDYKSGDGMLTSVWGPSLWHYLHTMSFNYPIHPTVQDKKHYKEFILALKYVLPCKYCRINLKDNLKNIPLTKKALKNRRNFSKWLYCLHEHVNKMLKKKSGLSYCDVRDRYENFRARCTKKEIKKRLNIKKNKKKIKNKKNKTKKEKGCIDPLYGKKTKCILRIIPKEVKTPTLKITKNLKKI